MAAAALTAFRSYAALTKPRVLLLVIFTVLVFASPITLKPFGAAYPDLLQKFAIYGIFAIGFNILFGESFLTILIHDEALILFGVTNRVIFGTKFKRVQIPFGPPSISMDF